MAQAGPKWGVKWQTSCSQPQFRPSHGSTWTRKHMAARCVTFATSCDRSRPGLTLAQDVAKFAHRAAMCFHLQVLPWWSWLQLPPREWSASYYKDSPKERWTWTRRMTELALNSSSTSVEKNKTGSRYRGRPADERAHEALQATSDGLPGRLLPSMGCLVWVALQCSALSLLSPTQARAKP